MAYSPRIAIIGAGAVGGYYGGRLAEHGLDVHFLLRSDYDAWRANGLRIKSIDGDFVLLPRDLHVYNDPASMSKVDLVIVTLKSTENRHLGRLISPVLHDETTILTLQNGLGNEQTLADLFGASRVVGGIAFTCINRIEAGVIEHSDYGHLRIGEFAKRGKSERVEQITAMFNASKVRAEAIDDLKLGRWDKQVWNIPFNGLGALLDVTTDRLLADEVGTSVVRAIMNEVLQAAKIDGVQLPSHTPDQKIAATRKVGAYRTSTQIDRCLRKRMEIESIFGLPVQIAREAGQHLSLLEMLYFALRQIDANQSDKNM
jgi:2-dehydropantoate 2-reductase